VCINISCAEGGSEGLLHTLNEKLAGSAVEVKTHICFGACWMGPNIVLYPQGTWYSNVQPGDIDDIVAHIEGGAPVARLVSNVDEQLHGLVLSLLEAGLD
jgi:NADP-reducing hydrogenase subunit HndC